MMPLSTSVAFAFVSVWRMTSAVRWPAPRPETGLRMTLIVSIVPPAVRCCYEYDNTAGCLELLSREDSFLTFACKYGIIGIDCQDKIRQDTDGL